MLEHMIFEVVRIDVVSRRERTMWDDWVSEGVIFEDLRGFVAETGRVREWGGCASRSDRVVSYGRVSGLDLGGSKLLLYSRVPCPLGFHLPVVS